MYFIEPQKIMANISSPYINGRSDRLSLIFTYRHFNGMMSDKVSIFYLPNRPTEEAHCALSCIRENVGKGIG